MPHQADREANHALWARLDDVKAQYDRTRAGMDDLRDRLADLTVTAESADGLVRATVGPRGRLVGLDLDPGIYRDGDQGELARTILRTIDQAVTTTDDQVRKLLGEYLPADSIVASLLQEPDA